MQSFFFTNTVFINKCLSCGDIEPEMNNHFLHPMTARLVRSINVYAFDNLVDDIRRKL